MTQSPPPDASPETPTPGDIEAALSDLRAQIAAPPAPDAGLVHEAEPRSGGWTGTAALLVMSAMLGAGAATFAPPLLGMAPQGQEDARRRIGDLETRIGQLAAGQSGEAAAQSYADLRAHVDGLDVRLRALEADSGGAEREDRTAALAAVETALGDLKSRVAALEARPETPAPTPQPQPQIQPTPAPQPPVPDMSGEVAALKSALAELSSRLGRLEQTAPAGDLIASLDGRLTALEAADPGRASRQAALALIVARLGDAAGAGRPFRAELAALTSAAPAVDVSAFAAYADKGLPTVPVLAAGLEAIDGAVREGADFDRGGDWWDRFWRGFGRLITVREDGLADGREPEDHLARAHYHAGRGDLSNAAAEMDQLSGAARGAAVLWLADAKARLSLDEALTRLTDTILGDLARPAP